MHTPAWFQVGGTLQRGSIGGTTLTHPQRNVPPSHIPGHSSTTPKSILKRTHTDRTTGADATSSGDSGDKAGEPHRATQAPSTSQSSITLDNTPHHSVSGTLSLGPQVGLWWSPGHLRKALCGQRTIQILHQATTGDNVPLPSQEPTEDLTSTPITAQDADEDSPTASSQTPPSS